MDKGYGIRIVSVTILVLSMAVTASATTWSVDGSGDADFTWIQDAINNASTGDTILVYSGVYYENVVVDKSVTLKGIGHPVVDASGEGDAITLNADGIKLQGFNAINSGSSWRCAEIEVISSNNVPESSFAAAFSNAGIEVISSNNTITGNNASNNSVGIHLYDSSNNSITGNNANNNRLGIYLNDSSNNNTFTGNNASNNIFGIYLDDSSNNNTFTGNNASNNSVGIHLDDSSNNSITGNNVYNNNKGIVLSPSSNNNIITGNNASNNGVGIHLDDSSNNTITGNDVSNNYWYGIYLDDSSNNNTFTGNTFVNDGLFVFNSYQNTVEDNTVNGRPLVYLEDVSDYTVEDAGQVILVKCNNITVENQDLSNTCVGIKLFETEDSKVLNNTVSNNRYGIYLRHSNNNTITGNNVSNNNWDGIYLSFSRNNTITENTFVNDGLSVRWFYQNTVENNTVNGKPLVYLEDASDVKIADAGQVILMNCNNITVENQDLSNTSVGIELWNTEDSKVLNNIVSNNNKNGIYLSFSSNNTIRGNNVCNNKYDGISLSPSSNNNIIYFNNVINNTDNVDSSASTNIWNSPSEMTYTYDGTTYESYLGNYWEDYEGTDAEGDGIGDKPYSIDSKGDERDYYPLMKHFENYYITTSAHP